MKIEGNYVLRQVGDSFVAVNLSGGTQILNMNETGAFIFKQLQNPTTIAHITEAMMAEYDVEAPVADNAIRQFVDRLTEAGVLLA